MTLPRSSVERSRGITICGNFTCSNRLRWKQSVGRGHSQHRFQQLELPRHAASFLREPWVRLGQQHSSAPCLRRYSQRPRIIPRFFENIIERELSAARSHAKEECEYIFHFHSQGDITNTAQVAPCMIHTSLTDTRVSFYESGIAYFRRLRSATPRPMSHDWVLRSLL